MIALLESGTVFQKENNFEKFNVALVIIATFEFCLTLGFLILNGLTPDQSP